MTCVFCNPQAIGKPEAVGMYSADGEFISFTRLLQLDKAVEVRRSHRPPCYMKVSVWTQSHT